MFSSSLQLSKQSMPKHWNDWISATLGAPIYLSQCASGCLEVLVRAVGFEPTRAFALRILSPVCLPIPSRPQIGLHLSRGGKKARAATQAPHRARR